MILKPLRRNFNMERLIGPLLCGNAHLHVLAMTVLTLLVVVRTLTRGVPRVNTRVDYWQMRTSSQLIGTLKGIEGAATPWLVSPDR